MLTCKRCGEEVGRQGERRLVHLREEIVEFRGDHEREVIVDAGVFCSRGCLVGYIGKEPSRG